MTSDLKILYVDHYISTSKDAWLTVLEEYGSVDVHYAQDFSMSHRNVDPVINYIRREKPDHVFFSSGIVWDLINIPPLANLLREKTFTSTRFYGDVMRFWDRCFAPSADLVTAMFVTNTHDADSTPNTHFTLCPAWDSPREPVRDKFQWDLVFTGGPRREKSSSRVDLIKGLTGQMGHKFQLFGRGWSPFGVQCNYALPYQCMQHVYPNARAILNHMDPCHSSFGRCASNRFWNAMHSGRPVITGKIDGIDEIVTPGKHYIEIPREEFTPERVVEVLNSYSDEDLNEIGRAGRAWVRENNTYAILAQRMLRICGYDV